MLYEVITRSQDLLDLICFCFALGALDVDPWVTLPRGLIDPVACSFLPRLSKIVVADTTYIRKADILRIASHLLNYVVNPWHGSIVSLVILMSSAND